MLFTFFITQSHINYLEFFKEMNRKTSRIIIFIYIHRTGIDHVDHYTVIYYINVCI